VSSDVFGVVLLIAGAIKAFHYKQVKKAAAWTQAVPRALVQIIGLAEILGALGPKETDTRQRLRESSVRGEPSPALGRQLNDERNWSPDACIYPNAPAPGQNHCRYRERAAYVDLPIC
jgi:DoxX-like family